MQEVGISRSAFGASASYLWEWPMSVRSLAHAGGWFWWYLGQHWIARGHSARSSLETVTDSRVRGADCAASSGQAGGPWPEGKLPPSFWHQNWNTNRGQTSQLSQTRGKAAGMSFPRTHITALLLFFLVTKDQEPQNFQFHIYDTSRETVSLEFFLKDLKTPLHTSFHICTGTFYRNLDLPPQGGLFKVYKVSPKCTKGSIFPSVQNVFRIPLYCMENALQV